MNIAHAQNCTKEHGYSVRLQKNAEIRMGGMKK